METSQQMLIKPRGEPAIAVGIDNGTVRRREENSVTA